MSMNKINFLSYVEERTVVVVKVAQSCPTLRPHGLYSPWNSPGQNTGMGSLFLLQGIFPTQGSNPGLPHCRRILHQLSHKGRQGILEWVAYPFSSTSSQPRNRTGVSYMAGRFFNNWVIREPQITCQYILKYFIGPTTLKGLGTLTTPGSQLKILKSSTSRAIANRGRHMLMRAINKPQPSRVPVQIVYLPMIQWTF